MFSVNDVSLIILQKYENETGHLIPISFIKDLKSEIVRSFLVYGNLKVIRGDHAHKECNQYLSCLHGSCKVYLDDGTNKKSFILNKPEIILKIPYSIWSYQEYQLPNSILFVSCDKEYDEKDYIRNYEDFKNFRKEIQCKNFY